MQYLLSWLFSLVRSTFKERRDLALEKLALRQQVAVLKRLQKRPPIENRIACSGPGCLEFGLDGENL
jgi:hypothetical protein